jgi:exosortase/archaeosortase family protein
MKARKSINYVFTVFAVLLAFFPFLTTFNEMMTRFAETLGFYRFIQAWVVPIEVKMVAVLLSPLAIKLTVYNESAMLVNGRFAHITWNCIGWQSMLLLCITLLIGLQGNYSFSSRIEVILIGIVGTYLMNILRMAFIVGLFVYSLPLFAIIYHNILAIVATLSWLFCFWWFCYTYILVRT